MQKTSKMIMIPEWQYEKIMESYDEAMEELRKLKEELNSLRPHISDDLN